MDALKTHAGVIVIALLAALILFRRREANAAPAAVVAGGNPPIAPSSAGSAAPVVNAKSIKGAFSMVAKRGAASGGGSGSLGSALQSGASSLISTGTTIAQRKLADKLGSFSF